MERPESMESLSLHEICQKYSWSKSQWRRRKSTTHVVVRTYPRYSPNPEDDRYEDYCRTKVILHHPFRSLDDLNILNGEEKTWAEVFAECRAQNHTHPADTLRSWEDENRELEDDEDEDEDVPNPDITDMTEEDWQTWAHLHPNVQIPQYNASDLGRRPIDDGWDLEVSRQRWNSIESLSTWLDEKKREAPVEDNEMDNGAPIDITTLEDEQRTIYEGYIDTYRRILAGEAVEQVLLNIDGTAGCGKTYLIRAICQELRAMAIQHNKTDPIRVLAPSGVAALNINGRTLHSSLCLPLQGFSPLAGTRLATLQVQWKGAHFVIIDEKSMVGLRTLAQVDS